MFLFLEFSDILPNSLISSEKTPGSLSIKHQLPALSAMTNEKISNNKMNKQSCILKDWGDFLVWFEDFNPKITEPIKAFS